MKGLEAMYQVNMVTDGGARGHVPGKHTYILYNLIKCMYLFERTIHFKMDKHDYTLIELG